MIINNNNNPLSLSSSILNNNNNNCQTNNQNNNINNNNNVNLNGSDELTRFTPPPPNQLKRSRYDEDFNESERIGKGGYGSVYKVQNKLDGLYYALKKIPFKNSSQTFLEKVLREVKTLASLNHPNIVRYHSAWLETEDSPITLSTSGSKFDSPLLNNNNINQINNNQNNNIRSSKRNSVGSNHRHSQSLDMIDGNWATSEGYDDEDDENTLEIDTQKTYDNTNVTQSSTYTQNTTTGVRFQKEEEEDEQDNDDSFDEDSLNRLQYPPSSFEELQLFQRHAKPERFHDNDDSDNYSDSDSDSGSVKGLFRAPKKHFDGFSLDDNNNSDDENDDHDDGQEDDSDNDDKNYMQNDDSSFSDDDDFDNGFLQKQQSQLIPQPPKSTTPPITMPTRPIANSNNNNQNNQIIKQQSPPKSTTISQRITTLFIVMQLYSQTLAQWLENRSPDNINEEENLIIFKQICTGLRYIHSKGIIHRDLKPGNIFMSKHDTSATGSCSDGDVEGDLLVSLGDYGLATHQYNPSSSTSPTPSPTPTSTPSLLPMNSSSLISSISSITTSSTGNDVGGGISASTSNFTALPFGAASSTPTMVFSTPSSTPSSSLSRSSEHCRKHTSAVGTMTYSSPEQQQRKGNYNEKTDIYSLGVVFFELYHPFSTKMEKSRVLSDLRSGIFPKTFLTRFPKEAELIKWMMKANPDERPSACDILKCDIFGKILSVNEMETLIKQQQSIIEQLKQEIYQLKSPMVMSQQPQELNGASPPLNNFLIQTVTEFPTIRNKGC